MERSDLDTIVETTPGPLAARARWTDRRREPLGSAEPRTRFVLEVASKEDRAAIGRLRHEVFARELGQHPENASGSLSDALDGFNCYLVAKERDRLAGFISITPPGRNYSVEKYLDRSELPFPCDEGLYEVRLLTVLEPHRRGPLALYLMYAALRWVEARGGTRIVVLGRREIVDLYRKVGLEPLGRAVRSGAVVYDLLAATVEGIRSREPRFSRHLDLLERSTEWRLPMAARRPAGCFHGGAFFEAIGPRFDDLSRRERVINADVLDAWFPPSPRAVRALKDHLEWTLRTSPPTGCEGLVEAIARARGLPPASVLPGAGSSDLIFLALREWVRRSSRVLLLDPTYGEYLHVLERVIGARPERLVLRREEGYALRPERLAAALEAGPDLAVLVNPNSPTGRHLPRAELEAVLSRAPARTRIWIDETYVDYAGSGESLRPLPRARPTWWSSSPSPRSTR